jgi:hypothetical protein
MKYVFMLFDLRFYGPPHPAFGPPSPRGEGFVVFFFFFGVLGIRLLSLASFMFLPHPAFGPPSPRGEGFVLRRRICFFDEQVRNGWL